MSVDYAAKYLAPGIYIEESDSTPSPVESAPSAILGIIGFVEADTPGFEDGQPVHVQSLRQFMDEFRDKLPKPSHLASAMIGYYQNGGKQAYVLPIKVKKGVAIDDKVLTSFSNVLDPLRNLEEITILIFPDLMLLPKESNESKESVAGVQQRLIEHCSSMKNRIAILDTPDVDLSKSPVKDDSWYKKLKGDLVTQGSADSATPKLNHSYGAVYYPWIKVPAGNTRVVSSASTPDTSGNNSEPVSVPPSGHVAGIFARVDLDRGVHRAPANENVVGAVGTSQRVTRDAQANLNPLGVNCIRTFPGQGILVWGSRTLSEAEAWRYVNVRRLFCNIQDSIQRSTRWVVFEPNNSVLWAAIRRDLEAYLTTRWREGALFGKSPEQAFFVKCDEETNPKELREKGFCTVEVGLAAVRPAEFLIIRIGQWEGGTVVKETSPKAAANDKTKQPSDTPPAVGASQPVSTSAPPS